MIRCRNLHYAYGDQVVLQGIDLTVEAGERLALCGRSGCGKSTLLQILGLLDVPCQGHYQLNGHDVLALNLDQRARMRNHTIGFLFQQFMLIGEMTVAENVALPLQIQGMSLEAVGSRVSAQLDALDLLSLAERRPHQLSGGQQQRVALARALVTQPQLLLADEPTGALDSASGQEVLACLEAQQRLTGLTVLLVTHDPETAKACGRVIQMRDGRLCA